MSFLAQANAIGYTCLGCFLLAIEWNFHIENEHLYTDARHALVVVCTIGTLLSIIGFLMAIYFIVKVRRHGTR